MSAQGFKNLITRIFIPLFSLFWLDAVEGGTVTSIAFSMPDQQCFVGNKQASAVVKFTPSILLPTGGVITLTYPAGFFASIAPVVISGNAVTLSAAAPNSAMNVMLLTVTAGSITGSVQFTMTLSGLSITKIPSGSVESIKVTTSTDSGIPQGVSTGNCFEGSWSGICEQMAGFQNSDRTARCSRSACLQTFTFEFYVGTIRRKFGGLSDTLCYAEASTEVLSPFTYTSASTTGQATDAQLAPPPVGFYPGQRVITISTVSTPTSCYEIWINGTHFLEQGNQKSDSVNFQATQQCPLCSNCATGSACGGRCNKNGDLTCLDPRAIRNCIIGVVNSIILCAALLGVGPIEWNYRCTGRRDKLNQLQRFLTNEYQVGLKSWKKNANGTIDEDWFVGQVSNALLVPNDAVVFLNSREDFFNANLEGFVVPTSDQGVSDRGLIVAFMVARENRDEIEKMLLLLGHRLVLRRSLNAVSIRLRRALSNEWQKWFRLMPVTAVEPDAALNPAVPMLLFVSCAAIGMTPRKFWRAFPTLVTKYTKQATKAAGSMTNQGEEEEEEDDEDEEND